MRTIVGLGCALLACSTPTANVAGTYSASVTQGTDGCNVATVSEGTTTSGVILTITQTGTGLTVAVTGTIQSQLDALLANHTYTGEVDGDGISLEITGAFTRTISGCVYHLDSVVAASANGTTLNGELDYRAVSSDPTCEVTTDSGSAVTGGIACDTTSALTATRS